MNKILKTISNKEDGISAVVAQIDKGFSVSIRDDDANEAVGFFIIYPTIEAALAKAQEIFI